MMVAMSHLHYVSHPEVVIDPDVPVPDWHLSDVGRARAAALATQSWVTDVERIVSSPETKATQTAALLAARLDLTVEVRATTAEIDRSATGYVPADRHEELADQLFAAPTESAAGWERGIDAQIRMVDGLRELVDDEPGDVVVVGHGGVGTLWLCHLATWEIDRRHDQPGSGCRWTFDRSTQRLLHGWRRFEDGPGHAPGGH